ncbi:hypothetical protein KAT80_02270 [Candidatus Pacearchaeota archaeon]|nr:hypothetical protein [Candidatus Pacearchaeota archaeon]
MNPEKLKRVIAIAREAVANIEDEDIKLKSYEVILNNLLKQDAPQKQALWVKTEKTSEKNSYELLASKTGVDRNLLEDYIDLGDEIRILYNIKRDSTIEEQSLFFLIYLTIKKICYGDLEVNSSKMREILAEHQISLSNLSTHIKKVNRFIIHKSGKRGSIKTSYRITNEGIAKGLSILKEMAEGKDSSEINLKFLGAKITKRRKYSSKIGLEIEKLVQNGFFNEHKKSKEVVEEIKKRGFFNRRQDTDAYLRKVLLGKKLIREKINKKWHYVLKK